jgi:xylulokinase
VSTDLCTLGIDLGTGSVKAALLETTGGKLYVSSAPVELSRPQPGWVESDPEDWWGAVKVAVHKVLSRSEASVGAVGLSGQMHGLVLARSDGSFLRPAMLWLDTRAEGSLDEYHRLPSRSLAALANPLTPGMAGPMLCWLRANEGALVDAADWALQPKDWLRLRLAGCAGGEPSDASGTLLYDVPENRWAWPVIDALGLPRRLLAPLGASGAVAGALDASIADELGLPAGVPVSFGAADTAAALLGTGLSESGLVQLTVGSAAQVVAIRQGPSPDPGLRYHVFASALPNQWYALAAVQAAGVALSWALSVLGATWAEAYEMLAAAPIGANGVLFIPHLAGARSPSMNSSARGAFVDLGLRHTKADMLRAVFEGVAFSVLDAAESLPEFSETAEVLLAGGGSLTSDWRQVLCDVLGKTLHIVENPDASARGAALLAGRAAQIIDEGPTSPLVAGVVEPNGASHEGLAVVFEHWKHATTCDAARIRQQGPGPA